MGMNMWSRFVILMATIPPMFYLGFEKGVRLNLDECADGPTTVIINRCCVAARNGLYAFFLWQLSYQNNTPWFEWLHHLIIIVGGNLDQSVYAIGGAARPADSDP